MSNSVADQSSGKSNFTRKCSLLSQYLKEKGSFGDINLGLVRKPESKLGFAGRPGFRGHEIAKPKEESREVKTVDFIQQLSGAGGPPSSSRVTAKDADLSEPATVPDPGNSQLTIFFNGKVIIYDEFPVGKAKEIMEMAKQANLSLSEGAATAAAAAALNSAAEDNNKENCNGNGNGNGNAVVPDLNEPTRSGNTDGNQTIKHQLGERIARRASLHRFFAKRKERATIRAPYQVNQNVGIPPKPEEASPQLEQGQASRQLNDTAMAVVPKLEGIEEKMQEDVSMKDLELRL